MDQVRVRPHKGPVNADPTGAHPDAQGSDVHAAIAELLQDGGGRLEGSIDTDR